MLLDRGEGGWRQNALTCLVSNAAAPAMAFSGLILRCQKVIKAVIYTVIDDSCTRVALCEVFLICLMFSSF